VASPYFSSESRRPDIPRQDSPTHGSGRPIENERTAMVRICRPGLRHPFLPRRRWQAAGLITGDEDRTTPAASPTRRWTG
jgi:hypothetical protein